jgi:hypothetical protein
VYINVNGRSKIRPTKTIRLKGNFFFPSDLKQQQRKLDLVENLRVRYFSKLWSLSELRFLDSPSLIIAKVRFFGFFSAILGFFQFLAGVEEF